MQLKEKTAGLASLFIPLPRHRPLAAGHVIAIVCAAATATTGADEEEEEEVVVEAYYKYGTVMVAGVEGRGV